MENALPAEVAENLIDFCENRARVYALLARCYEKELDASFAAELSGAARIESDDPALADGFAALQAGLVDCDEAALEQLAVVFDRVFFGMGPRTAQKAFPYESVYTSAKGLMMQEAYAQVKNVFAAAGFAKDPSFTEPEDHVAVELAFMALLCERAAAALREGDADAAEEAMAAQLAFLREHLLNWIGRFAADVRKAAEGGFYAQLASFTETYLAADEAAVAEVVS